MITKYPLTKEAYTQLEKDALDLLIDYGFVNFPIHVFELVKRAFKMSEHIDIEEKYKNYLKEFDLYDKC